MKQTHLICIQQHRKRNLDICIYLSRCVAPGHCDQALNQLRVLGYKCLCPLIVACPIFLHRKRVLLIPMDPLVHRVISSLSIVVVRVGNGQREPRGQMCRVQLDSFLESLDGFVLSFVLLLLHPEQVPRRRVVGIPLNSRFELQNTLRIISVSVRLTPRADGRAIILLTPSGARQYVGGGAAFSTSLRVGKDCSLGIDN